MRAVHIIVLVFALGAVARGDIVHLKDGRVLRGDVRRDGDRYVIATEDGKIVAVPRGEVEALELGPTTAPDAAAGRLASLRRAVAVMDDLDQIIGKYDQFIAMDANKSLADEAGAERAVWIERRERGLVSFGGAWIAPERRDAMRAEADGAAADALGKLAAGDASAGAAVQKALDLDGAHPTALYLQSHLLLSQDKLRAARAALEHLLEVRPDHAPALNNLAYILYRQNQFPGAMLRFEQAMSAAPLNPAILDNVAEALHGLPESQKSNAVVQRAAKRFADQDARLQAAMAGKGLHRWGSAWIGEAEFKLVAEQTKAVEDKMADMESRYGAIQDKIRDTESEIDANDRAARRVLADSYYRDANGRWVQGPLPTLYRRLKSDNDRLRTDRDRESGNLQEMRQAADKVKSELPAPAWSGVLHPIGLSGVPAIGGAPTTRAGGKEGG